ncbi:MAG TPA: nucleotidyl transferase AbiEii/AbiGii toxin family protein [Candidatus Bathyarchaeia archaeon]|nr:nucleotidyl transferase AbiEii/AbiGii toxin family protein [Candidatus Bathyarchaeia archaeon]
MIDLLKAHLLELSGADDQQKWHHAREFLQVLVLKMMSDDHLFDSCTFVGGTCLRIVFGTRRFSEDLDFSTKPNGFDLEAVKQMFSRRFEKYGIAVELSLSVEKTVQVIDLRFPQLLYDLGLSPLKSQKLRIKWDVDTRPPEGAMDTVTPLMKYGMMFAVDHHDLPSLFAGKLHACFFRDYTKGRDWYDLVWFLGKRIFPNLELLNNAAVQTEGKPFDFTMETLTAFLLGKVQTVDLKKAAADVERFLEDPGEAAMINADYIEVMVKKAWSL